MQGMSAEAYGTLETEKLTSNLVKRANIGSKELMYMLILKEY